MSACVLPTDADRGAGSQSHCCCILSAGPMKRVQNAQNSKTFSKCLVMPVMKLMLKKNENIQQ